MLWIFWFWATISKMSTAEDTEFPYFIADLAVFLYFYPQYLLNGNYKGYWSCFFLKKNEKNLSGALKSFSQTVINISLSSTENTKI